MLVYHYSAVGSYSCVPIRRPLPNNRFEFKADFVALRRTLEQKKNDEQALLYRSPLPNYHIIGFNKLLSELSTYLNLCRKS